MCKCLNMFKINNNKKEISNKYRKVLLSSVFSWWSSGCFGGPCWTTRGSPRLPRVVLRAPCWIPAASWLPLAWLLAGVSPRRARRHCGCLSGSPVSGSAAATRGLVTHRVSHMSIAHVDSDRMCLLLSLHLHSYYGDVKVAVEQTKTKR